MMVGPWDIPSEEYMEAASRLERGMDIKPDRIGHIDTEHKKAQFYGRTGGVYAVSLDGCDCADFQRRRLPCKHMIRLAVELGIDLGFPRFDPYAAAEFNVEEVIDQLSERWRAGQLTTEALTKCSAALRASASKSKRKRGRPRKNT